MSLTDQILQEIRSSPNYSGRPLTGFEIENIVDDILSGYYHGADELYRGHDIPPTAIFVVLNYLAVRMLLPTGIDRVLRESSSKWTLMEERLMSILDRRRPPDRKYDQCLATIQTVRRRINLMWKRHDLVNKRILLMGDDDYLSIGIGLLGVAREIVIVEADESLICRLKDLSREEDLNLTLVNWDYRSTPPESLLDRFDVIFVDPPYTLIAIELIIRRTLLMLKKGGGRSIYLCFSPLDIPPSSRLKIQKAISTSGLLLTDLYPQFNEYIDRDDMIAEIKNTDLFPRPATFTSSLARLLTNDETDHTMNHGFDKENIYDYETW